MEEDYEKISFYGFNNHGVLSNDKKKAPVPMQTGAINYSASLIIFL
jgi:hypothetical protein